MQEGELRQITEVGAGGPDDPNGIRTAVVLDAYFHGEHTRTFVRLLWRRLASYRALDTHRPHDPLAFDGRCASWA